MYDGFRYQRGRYFDDLPTLFEISSGRAMVDEDSSRMDRPSHTRQPLAGNTRGMVWVVAATLSQAVGGAAHKVVVVEVPSVLTLVFMRALVAVVLLLPVVLASRGRAIKTSNFKLHMIRGLLLAI